METIEGFASLSLAVQLALSGFALGTAVGFVAGVLRIVRKR